MKRDSLFPTPTEEADARREEETRKKQDFESWLAAPLTVMCISMIPPAERPESLQLLLRAAFDRGFDSGASQSMRSIAKSVLANQKKPPGS